jgi:prophage tail gpP-like protein
LIFTAGFDENGRGPTLWLRTFVERTFVAFQNRARQVAVAVVTDQNGLLLVANPSNSAEIAIAQSRSATARRGRQYHRPKDLTRQHPADLRCQRERVA